MPESTIDRRLRLGPVLALFTTRAALTKGEHPPRGRLLTMASSSCCRSRRTVKRPTATNRASAITTREVTRQGATDATTRARVFRHDDPSRVRLWPSVKSTKMVPLPPQSPSGKSRALSATLSLRPPSSRAPRPARQGQRATGWMSTRPSWRQSCASSAPSRCRRQGCREQWKAAGRLLRCRREGQGATSSGVGVQE